MAREAGKESKEYGCERSGTPLSWAGNSLQVALPGQCNNMCPLGAWFIHRSHWLIFV